MMMAAGGLLGGCAEVDDQAPAKDPVAIQLTATVEGETALPGNVAAWTRADADGSEQASHESQICLDFTPKADAPSLGVAVGSSQSDNAAITGSAFAEGSALGVSATTGSAPAGTRGIQETSIANGQTVYLWADKGSAGTYTFLQAWELTSDGSGSLSGSTKYYPSDGAALTFRAVHGNFSSVPTSSTAVSTALTHSVATDQNSGSNYQLSDLMYGEGSGSYQSAGTVAFTHKLSKIEVNLTPGIGITASDIASAVVKVRYVKPTVTITPNNGTVSSASGTATTITAHRNGTLHEAVLPPQAAPDGVLSVTINGITATIPNAVTTFAAGNKYVYNVTCTNKDKRLNPLWYVAENNVKSYNSSTKVVTLETNPAAAGSSQCYNWFDAIGYFSKQGTSYDEYWAGDITDGSTSFKYHLPCIKEWFSIAPVFYTTDNLENMFATSANDPFVASGAYTEPACVFGYSSATKTSTSYNSYWSTYTTANVRYAIRFLGTPYCSVWKYQFSGSVLTITAKLIDYIAVGDASLSTKLSSYMSKGDSWWNSNDENEGAIQRKFYAVGNYQNGGSGGTGTADNGRGEHGHYWSTTESSATQALRLYLHSNYLMNADEKKIWGFPVRLFRHTGVGENRTGQVVSMADVTTDDVCKIIAVNGWVYPNVSTATAAGTTACGLVVYVGAAGTADISNASYKALAAALTLANSGNTCKWYVDKTGPCIGDLDYSKMNGIACTNILTKTTSGTCKTNNHTHAAANAAKAYSAARPAGASAWFLPSRMQSTQLISLYDADDGVKIANAGVSFNRDLRYWTSTEFRLEYGNGNKIWDCAYVNAGGYNYKNTDIYARAFFAF